MVEPQMTHDARRGTVSGSGWIIRGGRVIDRNGERFADVAVSPDGVIVGVGTDLDLAALGVAEAEVLEASQCVVAP